MGKGGEIAKNYVSENGPKEMKETLKEGGRGDAPS